MFCLGKSWWLRRREPVTLWQRWGHLSSVQKPCWLMTYWWLYDYMVLMNVNVLSTIIRSQIIIIYIYIHILSKAIPHTCDHVVIWDVDCSKSGNKIALKGFWQSSALKCCFRSCRSLSFRRHDCLKGPGLMWCFIPGSVSRDDFPKVFWLHEPYLQSAVVHFHALSAYSNISISKDVAVCFATPADLRYMCRIRIPWCEAHAWSQIYTLEGVSTNCIHTHLNTQTPMFVCIIT
jgi:hypothetical protein